jgi:hypothetical protein
MFKAFLNNSLSCLWFVAFGFLSMGIIGYIINSGNANLFISMGYYLTILYLILDRVFNKKEQGEKDV